MAGDYLHYLTQSLYNASLKYTFTVIKSPRTKVSVQRVKNPRYKNERGESRGNGSGEGSRETGISARGRLDDRAGRLRKNKTSVQQIIL